MTSTSAQGSTSITIQFNLDRDIDGAAGDVQTAIQAASRQLPSNLPSPPTLRKVNPSDSPIIYLAMQSPTMPLYQLDKYAENLLARQLSTLTGVAQVNVYGSQIYAARVQVDPFALAARGIGINQVVSAIQGANVNQATGQLNGPTQATLIHTNGQLEDAAAFNRQIISYQNGAPVRIGDVGHAIDSVENNLVGSWYNGKHAIVLAIQRQPGIEHDPDRGRLIKKVIPKFLQSLPKSVIARHHLRPQPAHPQFRRRRAEHAADRSGTRDPRDLPVSAHDVGDDHPLDRAAARGGRHLRGHGASGLQPRQPLADGADAVGRLRRRRRHRDAREHHASRRGGRKPGGCRLQGLRRDRLHHPVDDGFAGGEVFIPIVFMGGIVGRLLHEFAVTIILAIIVSGFVSVTLTPMLCARFIKPAQRPAISRLEVLHELRRGEGRSRSASKAVEGAARCVLEPWSIAA